MPRELELPVPPEGEDAADYFDSIFDQAEIDGVRHARLDVGLYRFKRPVRRAYYGLSIWGEGKSATSLVRDFSTPGEDEAGVGVLNYRCGGFTLADFQIYSDRGSQYEGKGTGALISIVADELSPGGTVGHWFAKRLDLTCASASHGPWPHQAYHEYGFYVDGSLGGKAVRPLVRTWGIIDCSMFGHEIGGASLLLKACSGGRVEGGYATWAGGRAATVRLDGLLSDAAQSQNIIIKLLGCMRVEFENAHHIHFESPVVEFEVVRGANVEHVRGIGDVKRGFEGDWDRPEKNIPHCTCRWN